MIRNEADPGSGSECAIDGLGEFPEGQFAIGTDVDNFPQRILGPEQRRKGWDDITDIAEATRLGAVTMHFEREIFECLFDESGQDHAVLADLSGSDGVEEPDDDNGESMGIVMGEGEVFSEGFGECVGPSSRGGRTVDRVVLL